MIYPEEFDVIVIGGGHSGTEACLASARMGNKTLLLTQNIETIGQLSCNPSMGGIGKGQLMHEVDALGGAMARCADLAATQIKVLNKSKGSAVHGHHAILDRTLYKQNIRKIIEEQPNLHVFQQSVEDIVLEQDHVKGVVTQTGIQFNTKAIVLTAGTFLNGVIHVGLKNYSSGRAGEKSSIGLAKKLKELKLPQSRLKTGTPCRIDGNTIDFSNLDIIRSDSADNIKDMPVFSFISDPEEHPKQLPCYVTNTNKRTHDIIREDFDKSPMFTGKIEGVGPRYCPSIEDKITRFHAKDSHRIVLEPEGLMVNEFYPNGISTSLPFETQYKAIRSIKGLEKAFLTRPGYAIEYDYFEPTCLKKTLETKQIAGLFFAGQIIGSTGYEEAAAMGILAGINAGCYASNRHIWVPERSEAVIGVMVDDLVTKGVTEPYRMFTSRSEYRLYLRQDNADMRLTPKARNMGLINDQRWKIFNDKMEGIQLLNESIRNDTIYISSALTKEENNSNAVHIENKKKPAEDVLRLPQSNLLYGMEKNKLSFKLKNDDLTLNFSYFADKYSYQQAKNIINEVHTEVKYKPYLERQLKEIERLKKRGQTKLPNNYDYSQVKTLGHEAVAALNKVQPNNIDQASRINGITQTDLSLLLIHVKRMSELKKSRSLKM